MFNASNARPQQGKPAPALANQLRASMARMARSKPAPRQIQAPGTRHDQRALALARGELDTVRRIEGHLDATSTQRAAQRQATAEWAMRELDGLEAGFVTSITITPPPVDLGQIAALERRHTAELRALEEAHTAPVIEEPLPPPTKLDRAGRRRRDLEAQRAALEAKDFLTDLEKQRLKLLPAQIEKAMKDYLILSSKGEIPEDRQRHDIDMWRAGDGRAEYNASRRTVRQEANADLSKMTDEQRAEHKREQARLRQQRRRAKAEVARGMTIH